MSQRRVSIWLLSVLFMLASTGTVQAHPKVARREGREQVVPGQWIVVLRDEVKDVDAVADELALRGRGQVGLRFHHAIKGFVLHRTDQLSPDEVAQDPRVLFIEPDGIATMFEREDSERVSAEGLSLGSAAQAVMQARLSLAVNAQQTPTGIDRVDADLNPTAGAGVAVAILDTGIQLSHPDLTVAGNVTFMRKAKNGNDDNGHGTHVAGIVGAKDNAVGAVGIAPQINLYAVKVLDRNGSGFWSDIVRGIDWVTKNAKTIAVANMSLGGGMTNADDGNCGNSNFDSIHRAICQSVNAGVMYVVAAGNSAKDAKDFRPAAYDEVITVSALADSDGQPGGTGPATSFGRDDTFATFSNFGQDVDVMAPGVNIFSTWIGSSYKTISGTSMSAPHVAGAIALWIAQHGRPVNGSARDPDVQAILRDVSEAVGSWSGDTDFIAEPLLNANTTALGGTGSSVCCPAP